MKVAIMQPAFFPPASYFRLLAASDIFVIYDDVQFSRRWFTHRQKFTKKDGTKDWLNLPIKKTNRDSTRIMDLQWSDNANEIFKKRLQRFPVFDGRISEINTNEEPIKYLIRQLMFLGISLGLIDNLYISLTSSSLNVGQSLSGQHRIIEICKSLGATEYINSPGGSKLYNSLDFARSGIRLSILPEYNGSNDSVVERIFAENTASIKDEIYANL